MPKITYDLESPDPQEYLVLFETTGWNANYKASEDELQRALNSSWETISAYEGDQLVGFGRVVSDGVLYGMIYDLITIPSHQKRGIGSTILAMLITQCRNANLRSIQLFSAIGKTAFYEQRGFSTRSSNAPGMYFTGFVDQSHD
jgi:GNAT superfamily N-acetyltransferase